MQIALLHYAAAPIIGGVERILQEQAALFKAHGHAVKIFAQRGEADVRLPAMMDAEALRKWLQQAIEGCELLIVHNVMTMPFDPALTKALSALPEWVRGLRCIAWTHDIAACNPDYAPVDSLFAKPTRGFEYVAISEHRASQLRKLMQVPVTIVPNGIDPLRTLTLPTTLASLARQQCWLDGRLLLLHPVRLLRRKRVEMGFTLLRELKTLGERATLLITGAPDPHHAASRAYAAALREEREKLGVDAVFLAEHCEVDDAVLAALYRLADVLWFPSSQEGFGLPLVEAALHRMPVVAAPIAALREVGVSPVFWFEPGEHHTVRMLEWLRAQEGFAARKECLARYAWEVIFARHYAPLLRLSA